MKTSIAGCRSSEAVVRRRIDTILSCAMACLVAMTMAIPAHAALALFNTGVNDTGTPLAGSSNDPHWSVVAGPNITAPIPAVVVNDQSPFGLYAQSPHSRWIWVNAAGHEAENSPNVPDPPLT